MNKHGRTMIGVRWRDEHVEANFDRRIGIRWRLEMMILCPNPTGAGPGSEELGQESPCASKARTVFLFVWMRFTPRIYKGRTVLQPLSLSEPMSGRGSKTKRDF